MQSTTNTTTTPVPQRKADFKYVFSMTFVVLVLLVIGILRHEMWRDELQAWCLARDSANLFEVHKHLLYEGHPISWYLPLFLFTRFTHDPLIMQLFNVVLTAGACCLVLAVSPFNKLQKTLFCLGYFPLFEYGIISRSYSLELLVLMTSCYLFQFRHRHPWWLFSSLIFLTCVNAYGLMLAFAFFATVLFDYWLERKEHKFPTRVAALAAVLIIASAGLTVKQMSAPADGYHGEMVAIKEEQPKRFFKAVRAIPIAYAPVPNLQVREFWNTDLISKIENEPATYILVVGTVLLCMLLLATKPVALLLYTVGTGGLVFFSYTHLLGGLRQQGHLYLVLLCSLWIASYARTWQFSPQLGQGYKGHQGFQRFQLFQRFSTEKFRSIFLTVILLLQVIAGIYCYCQDLARPFSSAKLVARFIKQKGLQDMLIIGSNDHEITSVSGYLDRKIFCPESGTYIGFVVNNTSRHNIEFEELSSQTQKVMTERGVNEALLILNYPLGAIPQGLKVEGLNQFDKSIQSDEKFYLYKISREVPVRVNVQTNKESPSAAHGQANKEAQSAAHAQTNKEAQSAVNAQPQEEGQ